MALILREMSTRYGRSPGGYIWSVLEPLGGILILGFGMSLLIQTPALGTSFILFYATGFIPFNLYQSMSLVVARSISFSKALLFYPTVTWVDAILARFILNALTGLLVSYILVMIVLSVSDTRAVFEVEAIFQAIVLAMLVGLSIGVLNCALFGLFRVWDVVWSIVTRPLFMASGIFFNFEGLPPMMQDILWYNPLIHIIAIMRAGFYPMYDPDFVSAGYVTFTSLICLALGLLLLGRYHKDILND